MAGTRLLSGHNSSLSRSWMGGVLTEPRLLADAADLRFSLVPENKYASEIIRDPANRDRRGVVILLHLCHSYESD